MTEQDIKFNAEISELLDTWEELQPTLMALLAKLSAKLREGIREDAGELQQQGEHVN